MDLNGVWLFYMWLEPGMFQRVRGPAAKVEVDSENGIQFGNERWLIERHGHRSPAAVRREHLALKASA